MTRSRVPCHRSWQATLAAVATVATAALLAHDSRHGAPFAPELIEVRIDGGRVRRGLAPVRVGFATDTHVGPVMRAADVDRALALLMATGPDVLLLGGDFICESPRFIPEAAAVLGHAAVEAPLGAFAVLGNHDYANGADRLQSAFECAGVQVLRNEAAMIGDDQRKLWVAGIDDAILGRPEPATALSPIPADVTRLALWHEPDWAAALAVRNVLLQLSGHSHGGQVRLPGVGPIAAPGGGRKFVAGLNTIDAMHVYTSRGIGVYRPPVRFRCPPEVTLVVIE
jgi:predicted MPP superfamily phosphohydrolase